MQRIPHDPEYVARLGASVYAFAYTEWLIFELVRLADPATSIDLMTMRTGENYLVFLFARDRLEQAIVAADRETASAIRARIALADARFQAATAEADPGLAARYRMPDAGWWWHRTPRHLGHSLRPELT
jgi:hypothetical protein